MIARWLAILTVVALAAGGTAWWPRQAPPVSSITELAATEPAAAEPDVGDLPVPPFPPRIAEGDQYDKCMTMLIEDPEGAEAVATAMQATGGGDGATHEALCVQRGAHPTSATVAAPGVAPPP